MQKKTTNQFISIVFIVLLMSTQPAVIVWADSVAPADHFLEDDRNTGTKTGYATPTDADQKDEDVFEPDDVSKDKIFEKAVVQWKFVDDDNLSGGELSLIGVSPENRADFDTVVSMLPEKVRAEIEETGEVTLPIIDWSCQEYQQDKDGEWPFTGEYEFIAELPEGYVCEPPISVLVTLGGAMVNTINDRFTVDGLNYKELGPDTVQLIGYDGAKPTGTLVIPNHVRKPSNGRQYQIVSIGSEAFLGCSGLTGELQIPDAVTSIGSFAFFNTSFTGPLILPDQLTIIGESAFNNCHFTGDLTIPERAASIGSRAFHNAGFTGKLTLPEGLTKIESGTFTDCGFTGELKIPDMVTFIDKQAFENCGFTGQLLFPDGVTGISDRAFYGCSSFTGRLSLSDNVSVIGNNAFYGTNFEGFDTTYIRTADLLYYSGISENMIQLANTPYQYKGVKFLNGNMEYYDLTNFKCRLTSYYGDKGDDISIPALAKNSAESRFQVLEIGSNVFKDKNITGTLQLSSGLESIKEGAFSGNFFAGNLTIPESVSHIGSAAFEMAGFTGTLTLPNTLTSIEEQTFYGCGFTSLDLSEGVTSIGAASFAYCPSVSGVLYLPESVTEIGDFAFYGCDSLEAVHLGRNVKKLGRKAFPESTPLYTDSPQVQLLINTYLNRNTIADTSWDGGEDVPDGAIASLKQDVVVTDDKRIGTEAVITVPDGRNLTVDGNLTLDGTLLIHGSISGTGTIYVGKNGKITGDTSGVHVVYPGLLPGGDSDNNNGSSNSSGNGSSAVNPNLLIGNWERTEDGIWKFRQARGTYAANRWGIVDGLWYYFDKDGRMLTGWQFINNQWYYLCREEDIKTKTGLKEGAMATGWHFDPAYQAWFYLDTSGAMAVGQKMIDGKQYYFNPESDGTRGALQP
ncbi:MAG: leucine-rich repeat protein [Hungatella hathewayi]|nr:leucine-rich repeat protein [Hungatella hathewayi]